MSDLEDFIEKRNKALSELDMDWAKTQLPDAKDDGVRLLAMHKARYECTSINRELRLNSAKFLKEGGWLRMDCSPLLPEGELPE